MSRAALAAIVIALATTSSSLAQAKKPANVIRSTQSGPWSAAATWAGNKVPGQGANVQVREGHTVTYDVHAAEAIRFLHIAGTLTFATDKSTRLDVGLIKIQAGDEATED